MWKRQEVNKTYPVGQIVHLPPGDVHPNPAQPRKEFSYAKLLELAQSIIENGMLQPLTVTVGERGEVTLVAGERRLRAARIAGLATVPCLVTAATDEQSAVLALVENLQREDLNCFEQAESIDKLIRLYGLTQEEAAHRLGCAQPTVANKLRLLSLSAEERAALLAAGATERHARALLRVPPEKRMALIDKIGRLHWTVAQTEKEAERVSVPSSRRRIVPLVRDVRLFFNTVEHALATMKLAGIRSETEKSETDFYYEYVIRIPKAECIAKNARSI